jgi:hypothetical protein
VPKFVVSLSADIHVTTKESQALELADQKSLRGICRELGFAINPFFYSSVALDIHTRGLDEISVTWKPLQAAKIDGPSLPAVSKLRVCHPVASLSRRKTLPRYKQHIIPHPYLPNSFFVQPWSL